nr:TIGR02217 family protein [uncultured Albidiferax sp.]
MSGLSRWQKRRLYPTCLCYHGCVRTRPEALTFREVASDIKAHVRSLQAAGYTILLPSAYKTWQNGATTYAGPVTCLHFDDCLGSIDQIIPWLISEGIPCGIAVITRRLGKYDPEDGFARWETVRDWVATGLVELMSHTHNMHHLTLRQVGGAVDVGPVLEGPCWIDDGDVVYRQTDDPRWYWDFSHVDAITLGVPLFGTDPWDGLTPIVTTLTITPKVSGNVALLRLWMALSKPSGSGYPAQVQIRANGTLVYSGTISPKQYETRAQWVEREFLTITLDAAFAATTGTPVLLEFATLNPGTGCALLYGLCTADDANFRAVTNCRGLFPEGSQGVPYKYWQYIDYPAGDRWAIVPCLILGLGTGVNATVAQYQGYVDTDCATATAMVNSYLGAQWAEAEAFKAAPIDEGFWVIEGWNYIPVGWNAPNRVAAIVPITSAVPTLVEWLRITVGRAEYFKDGDGMLPLFPNAAQRAAVDEAQSRSYPATFALDFSIDQTTWTPVGQAAIWRIAKQRAIDVTPFTLSGTGYLRITPINGGPLSVPDARCRWGVAKVSVGYRTASAPGPVLDQLVYPFGSYLGDSSLVQQRPGFKDISPDLKSVLASHSITHGYTIQAFRNTTASEVREPDLRQTEYALGRWLVYGDQDLAVSQNNLAAVSGYLFQDVRHRGVNYQVSMEADPQGNATIRARPQVLDYVAFDAWAFDGAGGIVPFPTNDGGTYDGTTYPDDRAWLRARGVRCTLIINNNLGTGEPDTAIGDHVVNNPGVYIPLIVSTAAAWDGITCNLEALSPASRDAATYFYTALARALHAAGKLLHATVPAPTGTAYDADFWVAWCDHGALAKVCDALKVMSYTESGPGTDPGPAAPDAFWAAVYQRIRLVVPEPYWPRIYCGCRAFGHQWDTADTSTAQYQTYHQSIAAALSVGARIDVASTEMGWGRGTTKGWCGTPATVDRSQIEAVRSGFGGIGLWKLDDGDLEEFFPTTQQIGRVEPMDFMDVRFPVDISYGSTSEPRFSTSVVEVQSGDSARNARWNTPLFDFDASLKIRNPAQFAAVRDLFMAARGRWRVFRFKDWTDYTGTAQPLGNADGVITNFQLQKTYSPGPYAMVRKITKPVAGTVKIYRNGTLITGWTLNTLTGLVSFTAPPAAGAITADFEFDVPVRFDIDSLPTELVARKPSNTLVLSPGTVKLVEVRL